MITGRRRPPAGRQPAPADPGDGPASPRRGRWKLTLLLLVAGNLGLQLTAARLIKEASLLPASELLAIALLMAIVLVLAFGRFLFWGAMHKRYPLSLSYPLNASIFPLVVLMAWSYGERVSLAQVVGALLVTGGVCLALFAAPADAEGPVA